MRRRELITLLGGSVIILPLAAHAQQPSSKVIGFLSTRSARNSAHLVTAFLEGLKETEHREGGNVAIEYRWAEGRYERLPAFADYLANREVAVLVAAGGAPAALAAKASTATIPVVFIIGLDPVALGLVESISRPGGNLTGVYILTNDLAPKLLELLHELVPNAVAVGLLTNRNNASAERLAQDVEEAGRSVGVRVRVLAVANEGEFEPVFAKLKEMRANALIVQGDPYLTSRAEHLVALAAENAMAAIYPFREYVDAGGLMSYGSDLTDAYRLAGGYAGRILRGEKVSDLPVMQSTKVQLNINLKTAKALGLTIPPTLLARADEVIE